jgi:hypothetical protein
VPESQNFSAEFESQYLQWCNGQLSVSCVSS